MQIRCPRCATEYDVPAEQIEAAAGMTHCIRCHHVFEASGSESLPPAAATADPVPNPVPAPSPPRGGTTGWSLGVLGLLLLLLGQLVWQQQAALLAHPQGRLLAEAICAQLDCRLPPRRDLRQIQILQREIQTHPQQPGALKLELVILNAAPFAQPYPTLELSLLDSAQQIVVRRRFLPVEYLPPSADPKAPMRPQHAQRVEMELEDPGHVSGFRFDFL